MTNTARQDIIENVDISGVVGKHFGNSHGSLAAALAKAQIELKNPVMDKTNPYFNSKYASLAAVRDAVIPVLAKHGIAVVQLLSNTAAGDIVCTTRLLYPTGEIIESSLSLPCAKKDAQSLGSVATYARRYSLQAIAGVVGDEDDDGNAAVEIKKATKKEDKKEELKSTFEEAKKQLDEKIDSTTAKNASPVEIITSVDKISQKKGTSARGEYTVYTIYCKDSKYSTFDEYVAAVAKTAKEAGVEVKIISKNDKYNTIQSLDIVESVNPITEADLQEMSNEAFAEMAKQE